MSVLLVLAQSMAIFHRSRSEKLPQLLKEYQEACDDIKVISSRHPTITNILTFLHQHLYLFFPLQSRHILFIARATAALKPHGACPPGSTAVIRLSSPTQLLIRLDYPLRSTSKGAGRYPSIQRPVAHKNTTSDAVSPFDLPQP